MKQAYTFIELVVTVTVLALLAGFMVPTYELILSELQLNSAVNQVTDFIHLATQKTVTEQNTYGITLNSGAVTIPMYEVVNGVQTTTQTLSLPANMEIEDVSFNGNTNISFTTSGSPTVSGSFAIEDTVRNIGRLITIQPSGNITDTQVVTPSPSPTSTSVQF